ncbi:MAG: ATP-dependent sacrificial sulfur transferase LarE [Thermoplasmata archaeon]|jgi:uncharacterized protein|nr:ATP-dependent sacrificial sulfur transferase LarE [Thermoplasmata archaeon]
MSRTDKQMEGLADVIRSYGSMAVAFSGGMDSSLVAKVAHDLLGDRAVAVTISSPLLTASEIARAKEIAKVVGIRHYVMELNPLTEGRFASNPADRCYVCKLGYLREISQLAGRLGLRTVADGTNADDLKAYRPGARAVQQLGVRSPLAEAGIGKSEVRQLSKALKLRTATLAPSPCLATRIPYGETITVEKLRRVEKAEAFLRDKGFADVRVRVHGTTARIEVSAEQLPKLATARTRNEVAKALRAMGFDYVTMDLEGYRTGSMDEVLGR